MRPRQHLQSTFHRQTRAPQERFFQRGDGLVALIRALGRRYKKKKTPEQQLNEYLSILRGSFPGELSSILAAAMLAKKGLDTTRQVSIPFPEEYFSGSKPIDEHARALLATYERDLQKLRGDMTRFNSPFSLAVAKGLGAWIASLHALSRPEFLPKGEEIWSRLMRGEKGLEEAYSMLLRRKPSDLDKTYFGYRPAVFLPVVPATPG